MQKIIYIQHVHTQSFNDDDRKKKEKEKALELILKREKFLRERHIINYFLEEVGEELLSWRVSGQVPCGDCSVMGHCWG
jgi:hypothetical protein